MAKKPATIGKRMWAMWEENQGLDMDFIVGPDQIRIPAHQLILSGASDMFATKFSENWKNFENQDKPSITLPLNTEEGVKAFIRGIYLDDMDPELSMDVLKELLFLSHEYMVDHVLALCGVTICCRKEGAFTMANCLSFVEMEDLKEVSKPVWNSAWSFLRDNLSYFLDTQHETCSSYSNNWSAATWEKILQLEGPSMQDVTEETLFRQLLGWRDVDSSREPSFFPLVTLIRFSLMDPQFIVTTVLPSKVLTDTDVTDVLCQRYRGTEINSRNPRFNCKQRYLQEPAFLRKDNWNTFHFRIPKRAANANGSEGN